MRNAGEESLKQALETRAVGAGQQLEQAQAILESPLPVGAITDQQGGIEAGFHLSLESDSPSWEGLSDFIERPPDFARRNPS